MKNKSLWAEVFFLTVSLGIILVPVLNAGVVSIPGCAARPNDDDTSSGGWYSDASDFALLGGQIADIYFPVCLPNDVKVKKFTAIVSNDIPGGTHFSDFEVDLERVNLLTGQEDIMGGVDANYPTGVTYNRTPLSTTQISHKTVNNNLYSYVIHISYYYSDPGKIFHGALIYY